ncbi:hypothetical protein B0H13DRAFT_2262621 [Mycena leptocephala]|nr:hypothetical protein B0H13DRAFT_2262621 [Mycena leptocephala]
MAAPTTAWLSLKSCAVTAFDTRQTLSEPRQRSAEAKTAHRCIPGHKRFTHLNGERENFETYKSFKLRFGSIPLSRNRMTDGIKWSPQSSGYSLILSKPPSSELSLNPAVVESPVIKPIKLPFELSARRQSAHCIASGIKSTDNWSRCTFTSLSSCCCSVILVRPGCGIPEWDQPQPHWKEVTERAKEFVERPSHKRS